MKNLKTNPRSLTEKILLLFAICALASAIKTPVSNIGTLTSLIKADYNTSCGMIGSITTITLFAFAVFSTIVNAVDRKLGTGRTIFYSLLGLIIGMLIRSYCGIPGLFIGTVIVAVSLIFGNVLAPSIIKEKFGAGSLFITGIYLTAMQVFCALAAGTSYDIATKTAIGWRGAFAIWAVLAAIAVVVWLPFRKIRVGSHYENMIDSAANIYKNKTTWLVASYMGLQSMIFYCLCAWYPTILQMNGMSARSSGYCFMVFQLSSVPSSATVSYFVMKKNKISEALAFIMAGYFVSLGILMFRLPVIIYYLGAVITGYCCGACFCLAILLLNHKTKNSENTARLSGAVHTISYMIAGSGPVLLGVMFDNISVMTIPIISILMVLLVIFILGMRADKAEII